MPKKTNRRQAVRFDLELPVRFAVHRPHVGCLSGTGATVNISRTGMMIEPDLVIQPGDCLTLLAEWPSSPSPDNPTALVVAGYVVWSRGSRTALAISRHELMGYRDVRNVGAVLKEGLSAVRNKRKQILPHMVLLDGDRATLNLFSSLLKPEGFLIETITAPDARRMVVRGFPPVCLLVTRSVALWNEVNTSVPTILTLEPDDRTLAAEALSQTVLRKPITEGRARAAIQSFSGDKPLQQANLA